MSRPGAEDPTNEATQELSEEACSDEGGEQSSTVTESHAGRASWAHAERQRGGEERARRDPNATGPEAPAPLVEELRGTSSVSRPPAATGSDATSGISIRDLTLSIGSAEILRGISLDIPFGTVTGIAGESGSGKTMTGMTILGLQPTTAKVSGSIRYGGRELIGLSESGLNRLRGTEIAAVFQDPTASLHPMLSIGRQLTDHVRHHLKLSKKDALARAKDLLIEVQVPDPDGALKRYPHQFSGGQLQRIAIASALACDPRMLLADEPTTALDVTVQAGILRLLRRLCDERGIGIVLITHDLAVMSSLADTISVMRAGEVVETGSRYDVIRSPRHPYTQALIAALPDHAEPR